MSRGLIWGLGGGVFVEITPVRSLPVGAISESGRLGGGVSDERATTRSVSLGGAVGREPVSGLSERGGLITWVVRNVMVSAFDESSEEPRRVVAVSVFDGSVVCVMASGSVLESSMASLGCGSCGAFIVKMDGGLQLVVKVGDGCCAML